MLKQITRAEKLLKLLLPYSHKNNEAAKDVVCVQFSGGLVPMQEARRFLYEQSLGILKTQRL
jgi:hypothetical protein